MREELATLNRERARHGQPPIKFQARMYQQPIPGRDPNVECAQKIVVQFSGATTDELERIRFSKRVVAGPAAARGERVVNGMTILEVTAAYSRLQGGYRGVNTTDGIPTCDQVQAWVDNVGTARRDLLITPEDRATARRINAWVHTDMPVHTPYQITVRNALVLNDPIGPPMDPAVDPAHSPRDPFTSAGWVAAGERPGARNEVRQVAGVVGQWEKGTTAPDYPAAQAAYDREHSGTQRTPDPGDTHGVMAGKPATQTRVLGGIGQQVGWTTASVQYIGMYDNGAVDGSGMKWLVLLRSPGGDLIRWMAPRPPLLQRSTGMAPIQRGDQLGIRGVVYRHERDEANQRWTVLADAEIGWASRTSLARPR